MASLTELSSHERTRVEDYLNDKIQVSADLESLGSLLSSLRALQELQRKQLAEASEALSNATKASNDHAEATRKQAEAFTAEQADIDRRLMAITQSETSDEAVRSLEKSMEKLQRLELSKGYVELLKEAEELSKQALEDITSEPRAALKPYSRLRTIVGLLKDAQPAAEGAAPHLVDYTDKLASALRQQMKKYFGDRLQKTLEDMKWPTRELNVTDQLLSRWKQDVELLIDLQLPELQSRDALASELNFEPPVLFPLEVMVHHLDLRFKYHFSGDKPTNRLDKPEYFLSHIMDLVNQYGGFFVSYLQPIFDERAEAVGPSLEWNFYNASHSYITALLPMLRDKISLFLPQISNYPQLLSQFIHELMKFDNEMRETWNYTPDPYADDNWKGITWEVLTKQGWYDRWLQVEKNFALARYRDIIDTADSGEIDYDGMELTATKPTKAAIRVNDLLETITDRYQPLSSFSQKLRFLIDIQITIFDQFHERLYSALEAYLAMTSTLGRTVQGADGQASVEGVAGLERLCRVFGSAEYLEKKMEDWSNDVFFVELWSELQDRVQQNRDNGRSVAGTMSVAEVASRTSPAVANNNNGGHTATSSDGALFDETASAYRRLRLRSETIITSTLSSNILAALKPYSRVSTWATLSPPSATATASPLPPTSDLAPAMRVLSAQLSFLSRALGTAPLRRVSRQLLLSIQSNIWDNVLTKHTFSETGAAQLASDVDYLCHVVDSALGASSQVGISLRTIKKLNEGLRILCLSTAKQEGDVSTEEDVPLRLWDVEKRLFRDNESARAVLAELEIDSLSEAEARSVLERRVEIGN
ncbi:hypothetical protein CBS147317_675 [Penicillium roqueforti]|uniref:uncharacterized protein n=1 Tax=Penicillium roqueforti TaxID=5082 RepID=UPI00190A166C|nr:uncharacterized protein LCP9604111_7762 [Penicillium roqueforti]KAF9242966.1 hypothetical protein LCP9604111_7762 [Penicillium roqueforti]KAI2707169.1 hypothetical protein CBS147372_1080 [Penicillium roqueforti]KAI2728496.1 hypothetical protein CBS147354_2416 [Penicillium roqueforti]KAI3156361.1 hypothetical protein CBS147325_61 [Penicillium roqueforti]KAI3157830.1 hypothetical protein DTO046C5_7652 [Penicillium roqueforti]